MIIGTAGHIDHGKTTLVRALTGVDTDRLKEEKARGISIELGYAYTPVSGDADGIASTDILGFIDVPGHEKFIHTMAAGAVGIDHVLLVVAADDGVMPQTREHLAITLLLGVTQGTVALTKADRVGAERLQAVQADIHALLAGTPLADAPIFPTTANTPDDPGTAALRQHLMALAKAFPGRASRGLFRLAVDRAFTLPGQGTIVTGTVFGGSVHVGDSVQHSASGAAVRVRSLHAQNQASEVGVAGQRVALNLAGIEKDAIARGDWIAEPLALQATRRLDVRLRVLGGDASSGNSHPATKATSKTAASDIAQWTSVHLHLGTSHHVAHVVPLQGERIAAGSEAYAQLVLDDDLYVSAGDHFILRNAQATHTIAGGTVLDPYAPERKRRSAERMAYLHAVETTLAQGEPGPLIAQSSWGISRDQLARLLGKPLAAMPVPAGCVALGKPGQEQLLLAESHWQALQTKVLEALQRFHDRTPDEPGVNAARLRRMGLPGLAQTKYDALWQGLLASLIEHGQLSQTGPWLHAPGHSVQLSTAEEQMAEMLLPDIEEGRFDPSWVRDLAKDHGLQEDSVRTLLRKLARQGRLYQVVKDLFYHPSAMDTMQAIVTDLAQQSADHAVQAKDFRDATALGRKRAIQVLEYFDRTGFTRRVRDSHVLRG